MNYGRRWCRWHRLRIYMRLCLMLWRRIRPVGILSYLRRIACIRLGMSNVLIGHPIRLRVVKWVRL